MYSPFVTAVIIKSEVIFLAREGMILRNELYMLWFDTKVSRYSRCFGLFMLWSFDQLTYLYIYWFINGNCVDSWPFDTLVCVLLYRYRNILILGLLISWFVDLSISCPCDWRLTGLSICSFIYWHRDFMMPWPFDINILKSWSYDRLIFLGEFFIAYAKWYRFDRFTYNRIDMTGCLHTGNN